MTSIHAHRGSTNSTVRENTLGAIRLAGEFGADGIELDVRRTADGCLVIHHDVEIGDLGPVSQSRYRDLPAWVPTLEEALGACVDAGLTVNVEVKSELFGTSHDPMERCAKESAAVCRAAGSSTVIVVSSFSTAAREAVREVSPELALGWLLGPVGARGGRAGNDAGSLWQDPPWQEGPCASLQLDGLHPFDPLVDAALVARAHDDGLAVRVWPVDEPGRVAELVDLGVEVVITNDVPSARAALATL